MRVAHLDDAADAADDATRTCVTCPQLTRTRLPRAQRRQEKGGTPRKPRESHTPSATRGPAPGSAAASRRPRLSPTARNTTCEKGCGRGEAIFSVDTAPVLGDWGDWSLWRAAQQACVPAVSRVGQVLRIATVPDRSTPSALQRNVSALQRNIDRITRAARAPMVRLSSVRAGGAPPRRGACAGAPAGRVTYYACPRTSPARTRPSEHAIVCAMSC